MKFMRIINFIDKFWLFFMDLRLVNWINNRDEKKKRNEMHSQCL